MSKEVTKNTPILKPIGAFYFSAINSKIIHWTTLELLLGVFIVGVCNSYSFLELA